MKHILYIVTGILLFTSCSDFLDTTPYDALSPSTTWKTETDAQSFAVGCYNGWVNSRYILYLDCGSDFGYNNFSWEQWKPVGDGSMTAASHGPDYYDFKTIRRCNDFLENITEIPFKDEAEKKDLIAQIRAIRAYKYFDMNFWYGGVPIIDSYNSAEEAQVPRNTEEEVKSFIYKELDELIPDLNVTPTERGRVSRGTALAIKMRSALYWGDYQRSLDAAKAIMDLDVYELETDYSELFNLKGQSSKEIICSIQHLENVAGYTLIGQLYNNIDGGWSSIVPTQNLIDIYEMEDGLTKEESPLYDPVHPFSQRDPRMAMTVLFPGQEWKAKNKEAVILNTLDKEVESVDANGNVVMISNLNYPLFANNGSKTGLSWAKYTSPMEQYNNIWNTSACPILFRYAEVLITFAEASNEINGPSAEVFDALDKIRTRVGMPTVDRSKYGSQATLRELIRRERSVEFAGEGLRRADILRWKDSSGKMLAETLMNGELYRIAGTINYDEADPFKRAVVDLNASAEERKIETRRFSSHHRYLPIPQGSIDKNPNLKQNTGY